MTTELAVSPAVPAALDRLQAIPDIPAWSENLVLTINDPAADLAIWCHWGRMPGSPEVWEGVMALYLPGGELLVSRSFGVSPEEQLASSGPLGFRCVEPGRQWEFSFDGMARSTSSAEVLDGPLRSGAVERVRLAVTFTGVTPLWSAHGAMEGQSWAHAHLEQGGRVAGTVSVRDRTIALDAFASRDHSYGPRDYSGLHGDTWCTALFPSGKAFLTIDIWQTEGPSLHRGWLWDGQALREAVGVDVPRLTAADGSPHAFELELASSGSRRDRLRVEMTHRMAWTMGEPSALIPGVQPDDHRICATEGPATITWDGETGAGWIEKTLRLA